MNSNNAKKDPSTREFLTSIAMNLAFLCASVLAFILMRRKVKRIYQPKSSFHLITEEKMPDPLPSGPWQWLPALLKKSDNFIIQQAGLDGYGFLRYLYVMSLYAFFSILWMFPLLLPLNAVGGESDDGNTTNGLNKFSISHVQRTSKRYYGHVLASWVFFGGFLFVVYRELIFYTALRQAILSSPRYAKKLSSRTVLFQSVPQQYLSETEFSKLFEGVKRVWITRASSELASLVAKRDALAYKLEAAETAYLRKAFKRAMKAKKRGHTVTGDITDYLTDKERPRHRKVFLVGRKVDTIDHTKEKLEELQEKVLNMQKLHMEAEAYSSVFVEFESQYHAHLAHSCIAYHAPLKMCPSYLGIEPKDIVWFNTRISWWERKVGTLVSGCIITAMILFWAFITAGIATISNLKTLTEKVKWLSFLNDIISKKAMGLISGYLAPLILVLVMMIPVNVIRKLSIIAGAPTVQHSEFYTQKGYFAFQVVQVFLVTTIASSIIIVLPSVIGSPKKILDTLSEDLPKSSNFFISFMVLQGFSVSSSSLIQLVGLVLYYLMGAINDKTARQKWVRFVELEKPEWGRLFPVNSLLVVLMLSYSIISPIILLFASVAFFLLYVVHLYNLTYVYQEAADTRGMFYPRALFQSITGIYLGEICLLGLLATGQKWDLLSKGKIGKLFSTGQSWGPIILQFIGVVATYVIHRQLKTSFSGLLEAVPLDVMKPLDGKTETPSYKPPTKASKEEEIQELPHFPIKKYQPRNSGINSDQKTISVLSDKTYELYGTSYMKNENALNMIPVLADVDTNPVPYAPFWKRFIQPGTFCSYKAVKSKLPDIYNLPDPSENLDDADNEYAYCYPAVSAKCPHIWIPRDPFGFSTAEIKKLKDVVNITDEGAILNEKGKVVWTSKPPDFSLSITSAHSPFSDETRAEE